MQISNNLFQEMSFQDLKNLNNEKMVELSNFLAELENTKVFMESFGILEKVIRDIVKLFKDDNDHISKNDLIQIFNKFDIDYESYEDSDCPFCKNNYLHELLKNFDEKYDNLMNGMPNNEELELSKIDDETINMEDFDFDE